MDKVKHFVAGFVIALGLTLTGVPVGITFGVVVLIGLFKELWDLMGHGCPEFLDFIATVVGGVALLFIVKILF